MTWWAWVLLWLVLVVAAVGVLALLAWRAFQAGLALVEALSTATDRVARDAQGLDGARHRDVARP